MGTKWNFWKTDEGAEFHQGLIMDSWISFRDDGGGKLLKFFQVGGAAAAGEESAQDAGDVAIEGGRGNREGDTGDSACGVVTDSWQETEFLRIRRKLALGKVLDSFC